MRADFRGVFGRRNEIMERILRSVFVEQGTGCWVWTGANSGNGRGGGYPRMSLNGRTVAVHKVVYTHFYGYIPTKKQIDHTCENRGCLNPRHLELVSHLENQRRKGRGGSGRDV